MIFFLEELMFLTPSLTCCGEIIGCESWGGGQLLQTKVTSDASYRGTKRIAEVRKNIDASIIK